MGVLQRENSEEPSWKPVVIFAGYGVLLFIGGVILSGMGEGPDLALRIFGSPFSVTGAILSVLAVWVMFGFLVAAKQRRWAAALLIAHYLVAPLAVGFGLSRNIWPDEWSQFQQLMKLDPAGAATIWLVYVAGQLVAWRFVTSDRLRRVKQTTA